VLRNYKNFKLLNEAFSSKHDCLLEVTVRTPTDLEGGILVKQGDKVKLLELSQVPRDKSSLFKPDMFKYWNTNNMWVNLKALYARVKENKLQLGVTCRQRWIDGKRHYLQLEQPAGSAIQSFEKTSALVIPKHRYREVKTIASLFLLQSNLFTVDPRNGHLPLNPKRDLASFPDLPVVKFSKQDLSNISQYQKRFPSLPDILELEHLTVSGDVFFGSGVTLRGTIIIVAEFGSTINIPDGTTLENKIVTGHLNILDHF